MLNRLIQCAIVCVLACAVCAAQAEPKSARPQRAGGQARRPSGMLTGVVVSTTPDSLVLKDPRLGTTSTLSVASDVTVMTLTQIKMSDIKETTTVMVRPVRRSSESQPDVLDVQAIYVLPKGTAPGRSSLVGEINTDGTTPTLKLGAKTFKVRMSPQSYVFAQNKGTINDVKAGQIVRIETKKVEDKTLVTSIAIRANVEPRSAATGREGAIKPARINEKPTLSRRGGGRRGRGRRQGR
jgi:hypothetical protein